MYLQTDILKELIDKLEEARVVAEKTNDRLLRYLIERALSHARGLAITKVPPSNSGIERPESLAVRRSQLVVAHRLNRANLLAETARRLP
jgi:uncharacterized coiled-coil protein SlyX